MLKSLFDIDNPIMRFMAKVGYLWWLNILYIVCCLPIFTIGAATSALMYASMKLEKDEGYVTKNFFKSFKENFKQATLIWLLYLVVAVLLIISLIFWNNYDSPISKYVHAAAIALCILYGVSFIYVFAVQSKFVNKVKDTIKYSFIMAYVNIKETVLIALILSAVVLLNVIGNFAVFFITFNFGFSIVAYIVGLHFKTVFAKYIPEEREEDPDYVMEETLQDEETVNSESEIKEEIKEEIK